MPECMRMCMYTDTEFITDIGMSELPHWFGCIVYGSDFTQFYEDKNMTWMYNCHAWNLT
jgi:hypothetical protein